MYNVSTQFFFAILIFQDLGACITPPHCCIVMEFLPDNLQRVIKRNGPMTQFGLETETMKVTDFGVIAFFPSFNFSTLSPSPFPSFLARLILLLTLF